MAAQLAPLRAAPLQRDEGSMRLFTWSTGALEIHARYRPEWREPDPNMA